MTYVYRDPVRVRKVPVHVHLPNPEPGPTSPILPEVAGSTWGGTLGLALAAAEVDDFDRRTKMLAEAGATSEWINEYKRYRSNKTQEKYQ